MSESIEKIKRYAHVAEIIDRIIIETLKISELLEQANNLDHGSSRQQAAIDAAKKASDTASEQCTVLYERLKEYDIDGTIASLLIAVAEAAVYTSVVAHFENKKRREQKKGADRDAVAIANWDDISRDACEGRAKAKAMINRSIKLMFQGYDYPGEARTF